MPTAPQSNNLAELFAPIVGARHAIADRDAMAPYLVEPRGLYRGLAGLVLRPASVAEVAAIVRTARANGIVLVPQGGNTGLVGGQLPDMTGRQVVLSLNRMDRIREIDPITETMTVDAGVTLQRAREAADAADRLFPLWLPSEGSCTIGGNLSTNAGGTATLAFGNARDLALGLEVVLPDGRLLNLINKLRKDNTGYDLRNLFIGAEGTLGIITGAVLRLFPRPRSVATAFAAVTGPEASLDLLARARGRAGAGVVCFELIPRFGIDIVLRHIAQTREPLAQRHDWYVLIEVALQQADAAGPLLEGVLAEGMEAGIVVDASVAASLEHRRAFWRLRETAAEAQIAEGPSIKHDVSVPVARIPHFLAEADAAVARVVPGAIPFGFGHAGDGNIHYNVFAPKGMARQAFLDHWDRMQDAVHDVVRAHGGSFSAEHGIGIQKRARLAKVKDPVALALMRDLKTLLDPQALINPGKIL
jgi:FAD/FMN-containing dehydrogenase